MVKFIKDRVLRKINSEWRISIEKRLSKLSFNAIFHIFTSLGVRIKGLLIPFDEISMVKEESGSNS